MASYRVREFEMLGSQTLTDLRDFIFCIKDFVGGNDRKGKQPDGIVLNTQKKKLSASCLFIEDVFYVDTRAVTELGLEEGGPDFPDYSEPIRKWVKDYGRYKQQGLGDYQRQEMQGVTFEDLSLELNKPYLFLHQDGCQHVIMVRDIRWVWVMVLIDFGSDSVFYVKHPLQAWSTFTQLLSHGHLQLAIREIQVQNVQYIPCSVSVYMNMYPERGI